MSPELIGLAGLVLAMAEDDPKRVRKTIGRMRRFAMTRAESSTVVRIRCVPDDAALKASACSLIAWLDASLKAYEFSRA